METVPLSRFLFMVALLVPAQLLAVLSMLRPWFYMLTVKEQINTLTFWNWQGMTTVESLNQDDDILHSEFKTWEQLDLHHVNTTNKVSFFLGAVGCGILGISLAALVITTFVCRITKLHSYCWRPKLGKRFLAVLLMLSFASLAASVLQYLDIMRTLRKDQNKQYKGIPCIQEGPCYSFIGSNQDGFVRQWGPSMGWISALAASLFSLFACLLAWMSRMRPRGVVLQVQ